MASLVTPIRFAGVFSAVLISVSVYAGQLDDHECNDEVATAVVNTQREERSAIWDRAAEKSAQKARDFGAPLEDCLIPALQTLPPDSTVVIGHAYGRPPGRENGYLAEAVEDFLAVNRNNISRVIFTGDVFWNSTGELFNLWAKLDSDFGSDMQIAVAPGNHDRTVRQSVFGIAGKSEMVPGEGVNWLIEDSDLTGWQVHVDTYEAVREASHGKPVFWLRHHMPVAEMIEFRNSAQDLTDTLPTVYEFSRRLNTDGKITIILGDSGAFPHLPRITCRKFENLTFVTSGVGNVTGDLAIVISGANVFTIEL